MMNLRDYYFDRCRCICRFKKELDKYLFHINLFTISIFKDMNLQVLNLKEYPISIYHGKIIDKCFSFSAQFLVLKLCNIF